MPYYLKGNCVWSGTKENPGKEVKCHDTHDEAVAHMKALYANVEDAKSVTVEVDGVKVEVKGGRGSGWHRPPEGTHTAENAPNFRGGPGADRKYGTESDEPPEGSKLCKCTKCNSTFTLPKGKQCKDVECPGCGGRAEQTSPREDKPAEGRQGRTGGGKKALAPTNAGMVHGEGSMLGGANTALGEDDATCKCPKCGEGLPCTAKACPHCKEKLDRVDRKEGDKRAMKSEGDGKHPASHYLVVEDPEKPTTWHLRVRNAKGDLDHGLMGGAWAALHGGYRGNKYEGPNKEMALAKLKRFYEQEGMDTPGEKSFVSYKAADGRWRWMTLSNWAVVDKEREVVSEQAYRDAIAHAQKTGSWGEMDLVHANGTDVGDCDMMFVAKNGHEPAKLGAGGTWHDTEKATRAREAIQASPEYWGVSLKFRFNPDRLVRGVYTGDIQVLKHSILPQHMAASFGTAVAVQGGNQMEKQLDEGQRKALAQLGQTEEDIEILAEKQKALPEEENVVEKEDTEPQGSVLKRFAQELGKLFSPGEESVQDASEPDEARKAEEVDPVPAAEEPTQAKQAGDAPETEKAEQEDPTAMFQAMGATIAKMVSEQLDERDKRISDLEAQIAALSTSVEEKVEQRLSDLPPVVKVAASQVDATAVPAAPVFGQQPTSEKAFITELMAGIDKAVKDTMGGAKFQA